MQVNIIKLYAIYAFSLIFLSAFLAYNALTPQILLQIFIASGCLIGSAFFTHKIFMKTSISVIILTAFLIAAPLIPNLRYVFWLIGLLGFYQIMKINDKPKRHDFYILPILLLVILGSGICHDFQYINELATGKIAIDTFFEADIAAMYLHYGVASIGLDGLVPILYHTLSHKIMAGISLISGFETLATYAYLFFALAPLLLIFSLAKLTCKINEKIKFSIALLGVSLIFFSVIFFKIFSDAAL